MDGHGSLATTFVEKLADMQLNVAEHWNLLNVINQTAGELAAVHLNDMWKATNILVNMEVYLIIMEDCLVLLRIGANLLEIVTDPKENEQLRYYMNQASLMYHESNRLRGEMETELLKQMPLSNCVNLQQTIKHRPDLQGVLLPHVEILEKDRANELLLKSHFIKKREEQKNSVLWQLLQED